MKKGFVKKCVAFLVMFTVIFACQLVPTQAALEVAEPVIVPTESLELFNKNIDNMVAPMSFNWIWSGYSYIGVNGNSINIYGSTDTSSIVSHVGVTLYLQWYSSTGWRNLTSELFSEYNSDYVSGGYTCDVSSGYSYRVHAVHWASHNGYTESGTSTTAAKYIP